MSGTGEGRCGVLVPLPSLSSSSPRPHRPPSDCEARSDWPLECTCLALIHPSLSSCLASFFLMVKPSSKNTRGKSLVPSWFSGNKTSSTQNRGLPLFVLAPTRFIPAQPLRCSAVLLQRLLPRLPEKSSLLRNAMVPGLAS